MNKEFGITEDELKQLMRLLEKEYISHEFYPLVHIMLKRANQFLSDIDELSTRVDGVNR